ncbi:MAG: chromate transporter [Tissierellia bacterium]|nr:chromate transporter [Tissierellia bacterium]
MKFSKTAFLKDVFFSALASYGGPEAHYGVFSNSLVDRGGYLTEEELTEFIGLFSLVPGPGSTQTITAIGYKVGGPLLALLTFLVWALPAILIMGAVGVFFTEVTAREGWEALLTYLPPLAVSFMVYAAVKMTGKVLSQGGDGKNRLLYGAMVPLSWWLVGRTMWAVPLLLIAGGITPLAFQGPVPRGEGMDHRPRWWILGLVVALAVAAELLSREFQHPLLGLFSSFYSYGYSVIGGGQIVIPLMIQDLVRSQSLLSLSDFLSGYAIDQAIPGPLFSFASFVGARSLAGSGYGFLGGIISALGIFLPGILLVYFIFPIWRASRELTAVRRFLKGVSVTAAALVTMTALSQVLALPRDPVGYGVLILGTAALYSKRVPAPLLVPAAMVLGLLL